MNNSQIQIDKEKKIHDEINYWLAYLKKKDFGILRIEVVLNSGGIKDATIKPDYKI